MMLLAGFTQGQIGALSTASAAGFTQGKIAGLDDAAWPVSLKVK